MTAPAAASRRHPSIRLRLTAWTAGALFVAFALGALVIRHAVKRALVAEHVSSIRSTADLVRGFFRFEVTEYASVDETVGHMAEEFVFPGRDVDFVRPDGRLFESPRAPGDRARPEVLSREIGDSTWEVTAPLDAELAPGWSVRVRATSDPIERPLERIDLWLLVAVPLSAAGAALGGWWLGGRTLRPVAEMAAATDRITATSSGARLPIANAGDELGQLGGRVNALLDRLDAALAQQRRFIADAAHELRTPIARIRSRVELALLDAAEHPPEGAPGRDGRPSPDAALARGVLADIGRDVASASALVDELLQLARADADPASPVLQPGFLDDAAADAVASWAAVARAAGVALGSSALEETPARVEPTLVTRLLGVLVDNAIRYTPRGGAVDVRARWRDGAPTLEVEDSGIGIPDDERERVYERFHRGQRARRLAPEGTGLGLPIARWIATVHGATLRLDPGPLGGTLARVTFPATHSTPATESAEASGAAAAPTESRPASRV